MTSHAERAVASVTAAAPAARTDLSVYSRSWKIKGEVLEAAVQRARRERARAFEETIGALWRSAPKRSGTTVSA